MFLTVALIVLCSSSARPQCRKSRDTVIRIRPKTRRLEITNLKNFRVQPFANEPLALLSARVKPSKFRPASLLLTVRNGTSKGVSFFDYGISTCSIPDRGTELSFDLGSQTFGPRRKITFTAPNSSELQSLLEPAAMSSCKPLLTLLYVEYEDGTCWWPMLEQVL